MGPTAGGPLAYQEFFVALRARVEGKIVLANMEAALRLGYIAPIALRKFLDRCIGEFEATSIRSREDALATFYRTCRSPDFQFIRLPRPDIRVRVALALRLSLLVSKETRFITDVAREKFKNSGLKIDRRDMPIVGIELLNAIRGGWVIDVNARLGAAGMLVWATRVESKWDELARACERSQNANRIRNYLGLPHGAPEQYFELQTQSDLYSSCSAKSRQFAAPTVIDAAQHIRFRQERDADDGDGWGRAVDLEDVFLSSEIMADGAPEIVTESLYFSELEWMRFLGLADSEAPGCADDDRFFERLERPPGRPYRPIDTIVQEIFTYL